jgi:uncharacterized protein YbjT (DUF2867 family)
MGIHLKIKKTMKIVVTGSLGNISKPLTEQLIKNGHQVTVVSRNTERIAAIEALGASPAIGSMDDVEFLTDTFIGADAVYVMQTLPEDGFFNPNIDIYKTVSQIVTSYKKAIEAAGVKIIIYLSSIGGHTDKGNGMLKFHYDAEHIMNTLPADVNIKFIRPAGFYGNLFAFMPVIKSKGVIVTNYGGDEKNPYADTQDIADIIAEEFDLPFNGRNVIYVTSDEVSANEIAKALGDALGKELPWIEVSDADFINALTSFGLTQQAAEGFAGINSARKTGILLEDYNQHTPKFGKVKLADFARVFAAVYNQG